MKGNYLTSNVTLTRVEVVNWLTANKQTLNMILVGSRQRIAMMTVNMHAFINRISLNRVNCSKCLGVEIDEFLTWDTHISAGAHAHYIPFHN